MCVFCYSGIFSSREFGAKVLNLKTLMKALPSLFEHSDKNVRAEVFQCTYMYMHTCTMYSLLGCDNSWFLQAKALAIELYRWAGAGIRPTLEKNLKPVQVCIRYLYVFYIFIIIVFC